MSTDNFDQAVAVLLKQEGGFVDNKADPGGVTNFGISLRFAQSLGDAFPDVTHDGHIDADDIRFMSADLATRLYRTHFWDRFRYGEINDAAIATKTLSLSVNVGSTQAHLILQRAIRACWFPLPEDGVLGNATLSSVNAAEPRSLLAAFKATAAGFYRELVAAKPGRQQWLAGWLNRAYA